MSISCVIKNNGSRRQEQNLLPDFEGALVVRLEEVVRAVVFDRLPAVLPDIKDYKQQQG